jgi:glycosyltransferase involved in cell wall biosynthesis
VTDSQKTEQPIKTAVVYRVCQHWRAPVFARLSARPEIQLKVFHGQDIPGTKVVNTRRFEGFQHQEMWTLSGYATASGRRQPWSVCPSLFWHLIRYSPDVILAEGASNIFNNLLVCAYGKLWRRPIVWWTLGELPGRRFYGLGRAYRWLVTRMERSAHAMLGYSSVALAYFTRQGIPPQRQFRAVNCVDTERVDRDIAAREPRVRQLRNELDLDGRKVVLFVGALEPFKKIERLIEAFPRVRRKIPNAHLVIVGDGPHAPALRQRVSDLGLAEWTTFAGRVVEGVSDYFELADLFVLPGLGGLAISEAMAHRLPVLCGRADGCEVDLVRNGRTGYRFDQDDDPAVVDFLAERITEILADERLLQAMGLAARQVIDQEHNVQSYVAHIVDALRYAKTGTRHFPPPEPVLQASGSGG